MAAIEATNQTKQVVKTLTDWTLVDPSQQKASRRLHLHFLHSPAEIVGEDGKVTGLRTERTALQGDGTVKGTGEFHEWPVQAVYRAVGYFGSPLPEIPFDDLKGVISNREGRVVDLDGEHLPGVYATGWIKRGPVGLIGHTKSDASETVRHLVEDVTGVGDGGDVATGDATGGRTAPHGEPQQIVDFLVDRGVDVVTWDEFSVLDAHELGLGEGAGRERIKVVPREEMIDIAKGRA